MCGIIGYKGARKAGPIILKGLKTLEYRGYDSAGIATVYGALHVKKGVGKIDEVNSALGLDKMEGNIGIGHTRWATHGKVTQSNAHPHLSNDGKIAVVHNGIIENYQDLRLLLSQNGFTLHTETDTEVIPNLIEMHMRDGCDFVEAFAKMVDHLSGSYAIVAVREGDERMVATRFESPLAIGVGKGEYFVASDIPAFLEYTKRVVFPKHGDIVVMDGGMKVYNSGKEVKRDIENIEWDVEQAKKGSFDHFMLKEISEQAETLKAAISHDKAEILAFAGDIRGAKGVFFVACGTSYHACLCASYKFAKIAKMHVNVVLASEFKNYADFLNRNSLVIAVSQSGETADVLSAIHAAKDRGAKVASIVNVMGSSIVRESDKSIMMHAGPEICVLSTKTYTSQLALLTLIAYAIAGRYDEGRALLQDSINFVYYLTSTTAREYIKNLADKLKKVQHIYLIGRDLQYPTALEAALKIKEVSYIHAEGYAGGELKHGTIALIEKGTPCIVFVSEDNERESISNAMEIKARGGYIIGVGPNNNEVFDYFIKVREAHEANSICQIIPIQILAYQLALLRGCDPDRPRNLAKSVTVK